MTDGGTRLGTGELVRLVEQVFRPRPDERGLLLLADLPDAASPDREAWAARRRLAADWQARLAAAGISLGAVDLALYRNVRRNNADLPPGAQLWRDGRELPATADVAAGPEVAFERLFERYAVLIALTEFSATAPMKVAARRHGFRAATMPGFSVAMVPALRVDWEQVDARCAALAERLDAAGAARLCLEAGGRAHELVLDLRHRRATASGGLVRQPGTAGNLPSGETYIVPYEGEREADPSRSAGRLPLQLDGELLVYEILGNRVVGIAGDGPVAQRERAEIAREPAYANVAELGLGVLAAHGIAPVGEILLDEKLGLHVAFGRSDHFGGSVGPSAFTAPERVVHIDRVYIPEVQPDVRVVGVDLEPPDGSAPTPLMRDGRYV